MFKIPVPHRIGERLVDGGTFAVGASLIRADTCERRPVEGANSLAVQELSRPGIFADAMSGSELSRNGLNDRDGRKAECRVWSDPLRFGQVAARII
ncbi:hypothetical protein [Methylobacterium brachiatum]|uniref:hypothetical protein n=1 Tax=Methylobacterium brachiatum TaxID=269660 RepID=UPI000AD5EFD6|nr:hypothetical protein [Methylobacterium brachiatum]